LKEPVGVYLQAATAAAAIVVVALLTFVPLSTNDFWLHAAIGRVIWASGEIPRTALFPFTEASEFPFHAHEWLSSVALYLLDEHLGYDQLLFVKGLVGFALFGLAFRLSHRLSASVVASLLVSLAAMAAANYRFWLRPELFALLFTLAVLNLLVEYRASGKWRYLLGCAPVGLVWANSHGSFPIALVIAASFAAGAAIESLRAARSLRFREAAVAALPYLACLSLMGLAMLVNPYGPQLFRFAWELQGSQFLRSHIYEWMPTLSGPFVGSRGFWAFIVFLALAAALLAAGWKSVPPAGALLLLVFGYLALHTQRHIVFFAMVCVFPLSSAVGALAPRLERLPLARPGLLGVLLGCSALLLRYGNLYGGYPHFVESRNFSPLLVEYLDNRELEGNVLNSYALGAELVYRYYPRLRPAIDSRADVYGKEYFEHLAALHGDEQALRQFLARYRVRYVLLLWPEFDQGIRRMPHIRDEGWRIVFADHKAVLLARPAARLNPVEALRFE
jgi:hypothetical protein